MGRGIFCFKGDEKDYLLFQRRWKGLSSISKEVGRIIFCCKGDEKDYLLSQRDGLSFLPGQSGGFLTDLSGMDVSLDVLPTVSGR